MNVGFPLLLFLLSVAQLVLVNMTGNAFPGMGTLATRERNPRLFGSYYVAALLGVLVTGVWLAVAIFHYFR